MTHMLVLEELFMAKQPQGGKGKQLRQTNPRLTLCITTYLTPFSLATYSLRCREHCSIALKTDLTDKNFPKIQFVGSRQNPKAVLNCFRQNFKQPSVSAELHPCLDYIQVSEVSPSLMKEKTSVESQLVTLFLYIFLFFFKIER